MDVATAEPGRAAPSRSRETRSAGWCEPRAGGSRSIIGRRNDAVRSSRSSKPSYTSPSRFEKAPIEDAVRAGSLKKKIGPSALSAA